jgi:P-type conjugative transfer ATPase TrbB
MSMNNLSESKIRLYEKLCHDLGGEFQAIMENADIHEIMLNPDGRLWIDSLSEGLICVAEITQSKAFAIINGISGIHNIVVNHAYPKLEAQLPNYNFLRGERFAAQVPPIVTAPCFTIRKRSEKVYSLANYVMTKRMTEQQSQELKYLIASRKNILVCGGPNSGKTTVTNALINEAVNIDAKQRFIILEDTPEIVCVAPNTVSMVTSGNVTLRDLLRAAMRMRPDRILIGEVRGAETHDMLKAWNTGCPGGISTVHANGAEEAIQRITDLAMESGLLSPPIGLVLQTVDAIVSVTRNKTEKGFINEILSLEDFQNGKFLFKKMA